jgi:hypothetical protein
MITVELNKKKENPFFGCSNCLKLFEQSSGTVTNSMLDAAWKEVAQDLEKKKMFFSILFSIGDITGRQHNIFKGKKVDSGGNANRNSFNTIFHWLWNNNKNQFIKFMNAQLFNEYTCFDFLFQNRIQTKGSKVLKVFSAYNDPEYKKVLLNYVYSVINGTNPFNKMLVAKFLTIPRTSKRQGHKKMLSETLKIMREKKVFLEELSKMMGWEIEYFKGYREWRKQYNGELESVLFSTGKINEFTKDEFISWFDELPAQARFRVKNRILYSKNGDDLVDPDGIFDLSAEYKWKKFQPWLQEWEQFKEQKQQEQRILEEKVRQGQASDEDKIKLQKVKKEAKVTTGATNFNELYQSILNGYVDKLKLESFIQNKVNLPYNSLVIIDDSGSMDGAPFNFAKFIASVCLVKNPDDDARNLIGFFNSNSHWHSFIDQTSSRKNSLLRTQIAQTNHKPLVDPKLSFYDNYQRISRFCDAVYQGGGTYLTSIPKGLEPIIEENPDFLDTLKEYPIWTICSDGDLNSSWNAKSSMLAFQNDCRRILGFVPFVVMIEIYRYGQPSINHFEGVENMMYIPGNVAQIEQFLTNFKDMDIFDVYTPLLSLYRSNRYELVRVNTL